MTIHTPGPWKVFKAKNDDTIFIGIGETTGESVLDAGFGVWRDGPEAMANAHLAAAAPDLLEALENIKTQIQEINDGDRPYTGFDTELMDYSIAKATGAELSVCETGED